MAKVRTEGKGGGETVVLPIRLGGAVHRHLRRAARLRGLPLSTYIREAAQRDAAGVIEEAKAAKSAPVDVSQNDTRGAA